MHTVEGTAREGYTLRLDGPLSLFQASVKYGLQLAEFLPALLLCTGWEAEARVQWGRDRHPVTLRLRDGAGLVSHYPDKGTWLPQEIDWLLERWPSLQSPWIPDRQAELRDLGGRGVLVPELVFRHSDGRVALVELLGFWKKTYLQARLELLQSNGPKNMVVLLPWRLRAAEEEASALPGEAMVFKDVIPAKELLARLEKVGAAPEASAPAPRRSRARRP
jgi:predicted nuclease of restriction endonuclease-like RecB superfamily